MTADNTIATGSEQLSDDMVEKLTLIRHYMTETIVRNSGKERSGSTISDGKMSGSAA